MVWGFSKKDATVSKMSVEEYESRQIQIKRDNEVYDYPRLEQSKRDGRSYLCDVTDEGNFYMLLDDDRKIVTVDGIATPQVFIGKNTSFVASRAAVPSSMVNGAKLRAAMRKSLEECTASSDFFSIKSVREELRAQIDRDTDSEETAVIVLTTGLDKQVEFIYAMEQMQKLLQLTVDQLWV